MNWQRQWLIASLAFLAFLGGMEMATAQYAVEVVSYDQGTTATQVYNPDPNAPPEYFNDDSTALGSPERVTGEGVFPGPVTPFNPPFLTSEIVSVGESGHLTLRLSNFVIPQASGPEIGVFTNAGIVDIAYPQGQAGDPVGTFGVDNAEVDVSADGNNWVALGESTFDIPTNGHLDPNRPSGPDFQQPFVEPLSSFDGLALADHNNPDIFDLLDGSGGGKWLDISGTGLSQVGYIRFRVEDDGHAAVGLNFELDAVSIAGDAMGAATVPEPAAGLVMAMAGLLMNFARQRRQSSLA